MITTILIGLLAVATVGWFFSSFKFFFAECGTYEQIPSRLAQLKLDAEHRGIIEFGTEDDIKALFFAYEDETFFLLYDTDIPAKEKFEDPFFKTASELGYDVVISSDGDGLPGIRLSGTEQKAAEQAFEIINKLYGIEKTTNLEFYSSRRTLSG